MTSPLGRDAVAPVHAAPGHFGPKGRAIPRAPDALLTTGEVMAVLGVTRPTLARMAGLPVAIKLGPRSMRYLRADIDAFIARH